MTSRCDQVSSVVEGAGVFSSVLSGILAVTYYSSYPLTILSGAAAAGGLVGCWYLRSYFQLKSINQINKAVQGDVGQIEQMAAKVSAAVASEQGLGSVLEIEEMKIGADLTGLHAVSQELARSPELIASLTQDKQGLAQDNEQLKKEISSLQDTIKTLGLEIEKLKANENAINPSVSHFIGALHDIRIDPAFQNELTRAQEVSARFHKTMSPSPTPSTKGNP